MENKPTYFATWIWARDVSYKGMGTVLIKLYIRMQRSSVNKKRFSELS